jgi:hypothetical protein
MRRRPRLSLPAVARTAGCASGLLLGHIDDPGLSIFLQTSVAQFGSDAALIVAPEGNVGLQVEMPVDPDRARIHLRGNGESPIGILRPDATAEPELRIVCARDGVFDLGITQHRQNWSELLLPHQSRIVADVANKGVASRGVIQTRPSFAEALSRKPGNIGTAAFSRTGDPAIGEFGDAKVIRKFGEVRRI